MPDLMPNLMTSPTVNLVTSPTVIDVRWFRLPPPTERSDHHQTQHPPIGLLHPMEWHWP